MDMVEKVAHAIDPFAWSQNVGMLNRRVNSISMAREALSAMLDPTEPMKVQGELAEMANGDASYIWKAMIHAALRDDNELA